MDIPEATVVAPNALQVDMSKVEKLVAEEQIKLLKKEKEKVIEKIELEKRLMREKTEAERQQQERLTTKRLQLEEEGKRLEHTRQDMEWRARNPEAARIKDEMLATEAARKVEAARRQAAQQAEAAKREAEQRQAEELFKHQLKIQMEKSRTENELALAEKHRKDFKLRVGFVACAMIGAGFGMLANL